MKSSSGKQTRKRYGVLALLFVTVVINYMDRSNISIAAFEMSDELGLTTVQMGIIFSAFAWTYSTLQIPGGILVDIMRARILYPLILALWSVATLIQGLVSNLWTLIVCRSSIGVFEAPSYPMNNKIVTRWFPENERATAIAIYTSGQFIGLAFLTPTLLAIQAALGWRGLFIVSGLIGLVWAVIWYFFYRDPENHRTVSESELHHIRSGGGLIEEPVPTVDKKTSSFNWSDLKEAFRYRKLWGVYLGQYCLGTLFIFFLTWFPTYLVEYRGLGYIKSGFLGSIPFLAAFFGVLLSGFTSDYLTRKGYSKELSRKLPMIIGMLLSVAIVGANYTDDTFWVILCMSIAFFGNGLSSIAWVFISLMAPEKLLGLVGGVFNFIGGLAGVVTPIVIGYLVQDGNFESALFFIGIVAFLGFCCYVFLVGKVERIQINN